MYLRCQINNAEKNYTLSLSFTHSSISDDHLVNDIATQLLVAESVDRQLSKLPVKSVFPLTPVLCTQLHTSCKTDLEYTCRNSEYSTLPNLERGLKLKAWPPTCTWNT